MPAVTPGSHGKARHQAFGTTISRGSAGGMSLAQSGAMGHKTSTIFDGSSPTRTESPQVRARGTDVSFAMEGDSALAESLDQAIKRGVELLQAETIEQVEQRFYSGRS